MVYIIPDVVLQENICSSCSYYLSVKPVKVYANRDIKCGRCVEEGDGGIVSLFQKFFNQFLFPCVNRYEGCKKVLKFSEIIDHEKNCISGFYSCLMCPKFKGNAYQLLVHYRTQHLSKILLEPMFNVSKIQNKSESYLYLKGNVIFIIDSQFSIEHDKLRINICHIGPPVWSRYLQYSLDVYLLDRDCKILHSNETCFTVPIVSAKTEENYLTIKVNIDIVLEEKLLCLPISLAPNCNAIDEGKFANHCADSELNTSTQIINNEAICNLTCCQIAGLSLENVDKEVSKQMSQQSKHNVNSRIKFDKKLLCNLNHYQITLCGTAIVDQKHRKYLYFCYNCDGFLNSENPLETSMYICNNCDKALCETCVKFMTNICSYCGRILKIFSQEIFIFLLFQCKWKCGTWYDNIRLQEHQLLCKKQLTLRCPIFKCCWHHKIPKLQNHFEQKHVNVPICSVKDYYFRLNNLKKYCEYNQIYIILGHEIIQINWEIDNNGTYNCLLYFEKHKEYEIVFVKNFVFEPVDSDTVIHFNLNKICYIGLRKLFNRASSEYLLNCAVLVKFRPNQSFYEKYPKCALNETETCLLDEDNFNEYCYCLNCEDPRKSTLFLFKCPSCNNTLCESCAQYLSNLCRCCGNLMRKSTKYSEFKFKCFRSSCKLYFNATELKNHHVECRRDGFIDWTCLVCYRTFKACSYNERISHLNCHTHQFPFVDGVNITSIIKSTRATKRIISTEALWFELSWEKHENYCSGTGVVKNEIPANHELILNHNGLFVKISKNFSFHINLDEYLAVGLKNILPSLIGP